MLIVVLEGSGNKLKKNPQNKDENINKNEKISEKKEENEIKKGFLKKIWYSIYKIEKYSELSAEGFGRAIKYLGLLVIILSIVSSAVTTYRTSKEIKEISQYIDETAPEFTYSNDILTIDSQEPIVDDNTSFGKIIIDTNTEDEQKINQYINGIQEENAVIILKDKLILKEAGLTGVTNYNYKELFEEVGITEFNKDNLVKYLTSSNMMPLYLNLFVTLFIYAFVIQFINTLFYIIIISIVGYFATIILRLRIRYVAVFNMAVYSITLPTLLDIIYIGVNAFYNYIIGYFEVMYIMVASIYMIAAIFILKSEFNKKQGEVQKIIEVEKEVKEEMKEKQKEENKEENKDAGQKEKNKKEKSKDNNTNGEEPEGSNA